MDQNQQNTTPPVASTPPASVSTPSSSLLQWWLALMDRFSTTFGPPVPGSIVDATAKQDAKNRLKLVLMHDRTQLSPSLLESMRDELVEVISKYVEIDQKALDLCLEQESNTIALVANISVVRARDEQQQKAQ